MNIEELEADLNIVKEKTPELYSDVFEMSVPFYKFHNLLFAGVNEILEEKYQLSQNEMDILECLFYSGGDEHILTPTKLYERLLFTSGGITKIVRRLEKKAFIQRIKNDEDKRSKLIQLTKEGENIFRLALKDIKEHEESCYEALNSNDRIELKRILLKALLNKNSKK